MWSEKIPRRKRRVKREEEHTCSSAFAVAGIAFAFVVVVVVVFLRGACARARVRVWLSESYLVRKKRELLGGLWATLLSVHKCPPPSLCCLTITSLPNCGEEFALSARR
jgi:hypothetical protein